MFSIYADNSMKIIRGDSGGFEFTILEVVDGVETPYILEEGDVVTFTVKCSTRDKDAVMQKTGFQTDESTVYFAIAPEDTEALRYGNYTFDIQFSKEDGYVDTLIPPTPFTVAEEVTF